MDMVGIFQIYRGGPVNKILDQNPKNEPVGKRGGQAGQTGDDNISVSATVILLREKTQVSGEDRTALETLMVQRSAAMGFAAGAIVFPGGKVDPADHDEALHELVGRGAPAFRDQDPHDRNKGLDPADQRWAFISRFTALRELFEETGILLAYLEGENLKGGDQDRNPKLATQQQLQEHIPDITQLRDDVYKDANAFLEFFQREKLVPATDRLTFFSRWQTPPGLHRRFDTWFYLAVMPDDQAIVPDGGESVEAIWATPNEFIDMGKSGQRKVIFPTMRNLELLSLSSTLAAAYNDANERPIICVEPKVIERDGKKYLTIPDDLGYLVTEELLEKAIRT